MFPVSFDYEAHYSVFFFFFLLRTLKSLFFASFITYQNKHGLQMQIFP